MEKTLLIFIGLLLSSYFSQAQGELWGMTYSGGPDYLGTIFKTNADGTSHVVQHTFSTNFAGAHPATRLIEVNGKMYGMTNNGGARNRGVIFEYDPSNDTYARKFDLGSVDNAGSPGGDFVLDSNGKLYGVLAWGGANGVGVLFEYDPTSNTYTSKFDFAASTGSFPEGSLVKATNGKLYAITQNGGANGLGVLFEYDPSSNTYTKKIDFNGTNGASPQGSNLIEASNGKLYGMTYGGGLNNKGIIFEYDPLANSLVTKMDFDDAASGANPVGSLAEANNGKFYGMTYRGGANGDGVLFEYDQVNNLFVKKLDFDGTNGSNPIGSLTLALNGKLYGLTSFGGTGGYGTLFEYDPDANLFAKKKNFTVDLSGYLPQGGMVLSSNGNLYGMNSYGGASNDGVIFEYDVSTNTYTKKVDFNYAPEGLRPTSSPLFYGGRLYGMTAGGGVNSVGTLFEFDPTTNIYTKKIDFDGAASGSSPYGGLVLVSDKFYGMTYKGGSNDKGVLFQYDPSTNTLQKKIDFDGIGTGSFPYSNLILSSSGKLFGMTYIGGTQQLGAIFQFDPFTDSFSKLFDFDGVNGAGPQGDLMQASDGKMYGMTSNGGANDFGVLFEFDPNTKTFTKKFDLTASSGKNPFGDMMQASNGKLYGMTLFGGANDKGTLFEFDPSVNSFSKKIDFDYYTNGANPYGSLTESSNGKLYGMTALGGANAFGILFEFDPGNNEFSDRYDFDETNGAIPQLASSLVYFDGTTKNGQTINFNSLSPSTYGDPPFNLTANATSGLPVTFTSSDPTVALVNGSTVTILSAGSVIITAHQIGDNSTYAALDVQQTLTVNKATLIVTADNQTKLYGAANPSYTFAYSGFVGTDDASVIDTAPAISSAATQFSNAGTYSIDLTGGADNNYSLSMVDATLTINQAALTVTADNQTKAYGANLNFTLSYSGFAGTDDATVIDTPPTISSTASQFSDVGTYPISLSGGADNNYTLTLVNGTLTVTKASLTATADDQTKSYGTANPDFTISYAGFAGADDATVLDSAPTLSCAATEISNVGAYPITLSGGSDGNYSITLVNGVLTITQAEQIIVFSPIADKTFGDIPFSLFATSSSGLLITYTSGSKVSMNRNQVTLVTAGRETIRATQPGNTSYKAASSVSQSFCIKPEKPSIKKSTNDLPSILTSSASTGNQWYLNGTIINGETNNSLSATLPGSYSVQVTIDDCISNLSDNVVLVITGDIKSTEPVSLYPNPSNDYLFIKGMAIDVSESSVIDLLGRNSAIRLEREQDLFKADIRNLSAGVYILKVTEGNDIRVLKFVKQ